MKSYKNNILEVVYATDDYYASLTGISIYSLLLNNESFIEIFVYIFDDNISKSNKEKLISVVSQFGRQLVFLPSIKMGDIFTIPDTLEKNITIYNNLFLGSILNVERVLYLDSDVIIVNSLDKLWNIDITNYLLAAVQDISGIIERGEAGLNKNDTYFNSGVMLFNLKLCKEKNIEADFIKAIQTGPTKAIFRSQRIVNQVCKNMILRLSPQYNVLNEFLEFGVEDLKVFVQSNNFYSETEINEANDNPIIIHFAGYERPWCYKRCYHKYADTFHELEARTPWVKIEMAPTSRKNLILDRTLHHYLSHKLYMSIKYWNRKRKTNKYYLSTKEGIQIEI